MNDCMKDSHLQDDSEKFLMGKRIYLRHWQDADAEALYKYAQHPAIGPVAGWPPHRSVEESLEIIRTVFNAPEVYAVVLKSTDEPIGSIGLVMRENSRTPEADFNEAEIGYWIAVEYWGHGLIPEAAQLLLERGFTELNLKTVWGSYYEGNHRSKRVMEKCGLSYHHSEKNKLTLLGDTRTEHYMKICREKWMGHDDKE